QHLVEHGLHRDNDAVEIEKLRLENLFSAIGEKLAGERGGTVGGPVNLGGVFSEGIAGGQIGEYEFALADDRGHNAVELVGDPARKFTEGFQFLGLKQL